MLLHCLLRKSKQHHNNENHEKIIVNYLIDYHLFRGSIL